MMFQMRDNPGRKVVPTVAEPLETNKPRKSHRMSESTLQSVTPFHSTTSTGFFSFEAHDDTKTASVLSSGSERIKTQTVGTLSLAVPERPVVCSSPQSSNSENMMTETRDDLLQGIKAMDDSIQTLKDEMNKLMSVYEHVKLPAPTTNVAVDVSISLNNKITPSKSSTPLITEVGQSVLEVVGDDEALIRFKDFGEDSSNQRKDVEAESDFQSELGVYHENEISAQQTLSPKPSKKTFKNIRQEIYYFKKYFISSSYFIQEQKQ